MREPLYLRFIAESDCQRCIIYMTDKFNVSQFVILAIMVRVVYTIVIHNQMIICSSVIIVHNTSIIYMTSWIFLYPDDRHFS